MHGEQAKNSSSQMGRFCSQWLLEIRFPCRDSENSSDYSIDSRFWSLRGYIPDIATFKGPPPFPSTLSQKVCGTKDFQLKQMLKC